MEEERERANLVARMLAATTREEIAAARAAAGAWLQQHPRDITVLSAGEQLEMMRTAREWLDQHPNPAS